KGYEAALHLTAASMGPRSCERGNAITFVSVLRESAGASMGPRSCERGNGNLREKRKSRELASMGPRSCERGNEGTVGRTPEIAVLQWGRARASAEMGCDIVLEMSGWYVASMGPRSCERGNNADDHKEERRPPYCFNGAALVRARKSRASASARRGRRCFNGAALVRARKWPGYKQLG